MSAPFSWPEPAWLTAIQDEQNRDICRLRFHIALAALYANEDGSILQLSESLGLGSTALSAAKSRGRIGTEAVLKIEQALGSDLFPWQMFRPDLVTTAE